MEKILNNYVAKIGIGEKTHVDEVIYYRCGMTMDMVNKWKWYFEYLAALIKVSNPKMLVKLVITPSDILVDQDYIERKTTTLLRAKRSQLKKLEIGVVDNDLFDFKGQEHSNKIEKIKDEINKLENGIFEYYVPPKYINKIKKYLI